jgi:AbrB family looped-hinge helix DNA binding protein
MALRVKVSSKHQIAVPAAVRRQLAIDVDDYLLVDMQDGAIVLIPESTDPIDELRGLRREIWDRVDAQEYVNGERGEWVI